MVPWSSRTGILTRTGRDTTDDEHDRGKAMWGQKKSWRGLSRNQPDLRLPASRNTRKWVLIVGSTQSVLLLGGIWAKQPSPYHAFIGARSSKVLPQTPFLLLSKEPPTNTPTCTPSTYKELVLASLETSHSLNVLRQHRAPTARPQHFRPVMTSRLLQGIIAAKWQTLEMSVEIICTIPLPLLRFFK
jgi:hypothetical protein